MKFSGVLVIAAVLGPFVWLFGPALTGSESFVFRDAGHFYYPLFQWTERRWAAGEIPLWNPQENGGAPVAADATSSVFYPGKLLFALPGSFAFRYNLYITLHVLLAAAAVFAAARCWGASTPAAGLAAVSYAFGGNVVFQYCNVVYLVGAAWTPLALLAAERAMARRSAGWSVSLGALLALIVLGGDPQAAYHVGLLALLYAWLLWRAGRRSRRATRRAVRRAGAGPPPDPAAARRVWSRGVRRGDWRRLRCRLSLLLLAAVSGGLLSAVQVLPSLQWTGGSWRAAFDAPRSLYELPAALARDPETTLAPAMRREGVSGKERSAKGVAGRLAMLVSRGFFEPPPAWAHHGQLYQFSIGPWRLPELLWPNCSGRLFPTNHRWITAIPAEGRTWTPSLYLGLLPLLLGLSAWRLRRGPLRVRWWSWTALLAAWGALGWYGAGWLIREVCCSWFGAAPERIGWASPVGGLYWFMVLLLPGYVYFRYPAKLLAIASLGLSLLAARGWDQLVPQGSRKLGRGLLGICGVSLAGVLLSPFLWPYWRSWVSGARPDALLGPLQPAAAYADLIIAWLHAALTAGLLALLLRLARGGRAWAAPAMLLLTAGELAAAHGWMTPTGPVGRAGEAPALARRIAADSARRAPQRPFRVYRSPREGWLPEDWSRTSSRRRLLEGLRWDRQTLFPRWHLIAAADPRAPISMVESSTSIASADYEMLLRVARRHGPRRGGGPPAPHPSVLNALAARYLILPDGFSYRSATPIAPTAGGSGRLAENTVLWRNPRSFPRAWIVHQVERLPAPPRRDLRAIEKRTEQVFFPGGRPRDLRHAAVVERAEPDAFLSTGRSGGERSPKREGSEEKETREFCRIVADQPRRVEIEAVLARPGLVVLSDLYSPGWGARVLTDRAASSRPVSILRVNRVMRGVWLPAGRHRITYRYRPMVFYAGAALSGLSWAVLLAGGVLWRRRAARAPRENSTP